MIDLDTCSFNAIENEECGRWSELTCRGEACDEGVLLSSFFGLLQTNVNDHNEEVYSDVRGA